MPIVHYGIPNIHQMSLSEHHKLCIFEDMSETVMNDPSIRDLSTFTSRKGTLNFPFQFLLQFLPFLTRLALLSSPVLVIGKEKLKYI